MPDSSASTRESLDEMELAVAVREVGQLGMDAIAEALVEAPCLKIERIEARMSALVRKRDRLCFGDETPAASVAAQFRADPEHIDREPGPDGGRFESGDELAAVVDRQEKGRMITRLTDLSSCGPNTA